MQLKIEITNRPVDVIKGNAKVSGKPFEFSLQHGYITLPNEPYPVRFEFIVPFGQSPYLPGHYEFSSEAISVNREGRLELSPRFVPVKKPAGAAV